MTTYTWTPISGFFSFPGVVSGTETLTGSSNYDDIVFPVNLTQGRTFLFNGTNYSTVYISTNGGITFNNPGAFFILDPSQLVLMNGIIAGCDLYVDSTLGHFIRYIQRDDGLFEIYYKCYYFSPRIGTVEMKVTLCLSNHANSGLITIQFGTYTVNSNTTVKIGVSFGTNNTSNLTSVSDLLTTRSFTSPSSIYTVISDISTYQNKGFTLSSTITKSTPVLGSFLLSPALLGYNTMIKLTPPTTTGNGAFSYTSSDQSVATITGDIVTLLKVGNTNITANQAETSSYNAASITTILSVVTNKTSDFYYRSNNFSDNMLLNDAYLNSANPISGLHRRFKASDFNPITKVWTDSAAGTTVTASGNMTTVLHSGNKHYRSQTVVSFDTTGKVVFNNTPSTDNNYTIFVITRYSGTNQGRIIDSPSQNWISGHHAGYAGVALHQGSGGWAGGNQYPVSFGTDFFIGSDTSTEYFTNGVSKGTYTDSTNFLPLLALNNHIQVSDGQCQDLLIYNRMLTASERKKVEQYLASYYGLLDMSGNLTAYYSRAPLLTETSLLVSTTENPNWIVYPSFTLEQTGISFSMWFKTNISSSVPWSRLFDFANGESSSNMIVGFVGGNIAISIYGTSGICQLENVIQKCNDDIWKHFIWTISPDGLTWKIYINRVLRATITSANYTNYGSTGTLPPFHPSTVLRRSNYIGKSNWPDAAYNGSIDEFRMYNTEINIETISFPWIMGVANTTIPNYAAEKTGTSLLTSSISTPNWIIYPSFPTEQKGLTFALWFRTTISSTVSGSRLFDFGTGRESDNIYAFIINGNLGVSAYPTGPNTANANQFQVQNVFPNCNDGVWRHFVWTISPDGLTWKIYINRVLQATITDKTASTYERVGTVLGPFHPRSIMRTSNYIGKSNWPADSVFSGSIDDFQMYNYPLDQTQINNPWTMDTGGSLLPQYSRERLITETSMLVSTPTNRNYIIYPSFNTAQTGMTFAFWLKAGTNTDYARIFDFSNGPGKDNIIAEITGGNLGLAMFNSRGDTGGGGSFQVLNAFSGITDNAWRHITWTISADGLTYLVYINKVLRSTITSGTMNSFTNVNSLSPFHPIVGLRSLNYLFLSAYPGETNSLNASMHAFQMWNSPLNQTAINAIYSETAFAGTYTLSQFPDLQKLYGTAPFTLTEPLSTGSGSFTYTSSNLSIATIENNVVTLVGAGTVTIRATQWSSSITATLTVTQPTYNSTRLISSNTNYLVTTNKKAYDLNEVILRNIPQTVNLKYGLQTIGFGSQVNVYKKNISCILNGVSQVGDTQVSFGKAKNQMWVMGGNTTNSLAYSYDGISWKGLGTTLMTSIIGIVWNGLLWVAVGTKLTVPFVANSYDGINWTSKICPIFTSNIHDVAWNGKMFVMVGSGTNSIGYSYNGIDWYAIARSNLDIFTGHGRDVAWNGRMWVAVGSGTNKIAYSYNGLQWFPNTTTVFDAGYGITYDGSKWIAVGAGTHFIADSTDGINWTGRGKPLMTTEIHGVASNGIVTVCIGRGGPNMCYSYGDNIWTAISMPTLTYGVRIKWNGTMFLAISYSTVAVFYSYDGIHWNSVETPGISFGNCVYYNNALENQMVVKERTHVALGEGTHTIAYSHDGFTWKGLGNSIFSIGRGGAYNGNIWVASGHGTHTIAYSYDGIDWKGLGKTAIDGWGAGMGYNGSLWIAVGTGTYKMATSTTGTSFTGIASPFTETCHGIAWNGKLWVAVGYGTNTMAWSTNGTTWTAVTNPPLRSFGFGVTWNGTLFVACGQGTHSLCWSTDGKTWTAGTTVSGETTSNIAYRFYSATWNEKMWIASGTGTHKLAYSYDGKIWFPNSITLFTGQILNTLWDGKKWIAGGSPSNMMAYSYDGMNWSLLANTIITTSINWFISDRIEPDVNIYMTQPVLALGGGTCISYSADGFTWTPSITPRLTQGYCAEWNGSIWIVGGSGTNDSMSYSSNGITWTPVPRSKSLFSDNVRGIAWNGKLWVAGGAGINTLAYSYDGMNWTPIPSTFTQVYGISWNGTMFMAAASGTTSVAYSYDGITWTYVTTPLTSGYAVAYNKMWIVSGLGTSDGMTYSYDGKTWFGLGQATFNPSNAIANNGFMWVAGGSGSNTLAYSYDGFAWTGLGTSIFSNNGYGVSWNGKMWIAAGSGTSHNVAYSVDGQNWVGLGNQTLLDIGFGFGCQNEFKVVADRVSFSSDIYQQGYKNLSIGVKSALY